MAVIEILTGAMNILDTAGLPLSYITCAPTCVQQSVLTLEVADTPESPLTVDRNTQRASVNAARNGQR